MVICYHPSFVPSNFTEVVTRKPLIKTKPLAKQLLFGGPSLAKVFLT